MKRYRPEACSEHAVAAVASKTAPTSQVADVADVADVKSKSVLLPVHTDPSLISVVLHDAPGVQPGAVGLEYLSGGAAGRWTEVPHHGERPKPGSSGLSTRLGAAQLSSTHSLDRIMMI